MTHRSRPHTLRIDTVRAMMAERRKGPRTMHATPRPSATTDRRDLWQQRLAAFVRAAGTDAAGTEAQADKPPPSPSPRDGEDRER
ncbi:MAG: hypothetical protein JWO02_848 [Solirubrobacterales bacterium]|nr:hypothetical protein [Solirubrobacterales bacterium]